VLYETGDRPGVAEFTRNAGEVLRKLALNGWRMIGVIDLSALLGVQAKAVSTVFDRHERASHYQVGA
jgi:hypothetical protein